MVPKKRAESVIISQYNKMFLIARKRVRNNEDAKDIVQQTMYKIFRILNKDKLQFKTEESISPYCVASVKNVFINHINHKNRSLLCLEDDMDHHPSIIRTDSLAIHRNLTERLSNIKETYRQSFNLSIEGYSGDEISKKLNIPSGTVRNRIFIYKQQAMKNLSELKK